MFEKLLGFIGPFHQGRWSPFGSVVLADFAGFQLIQNHIGHDWACFFAKWLPVMIGPHDFVGGKTGEFFQCPIPMGHDVVPVDHEGGCGTAFNDLRQGLFRLFQLLDMAPAFYFGSFVFRGVPQGLDGPHHDSVRRF